jgi:hypothetical protein
VTAYGIRSSPTRDETWLRAHKARCAPVCETCGWTPPACLDVPGAAVAADLLHLHHVHPVCIGGPDAPANLVLLCPTCHAIAHRLCLWRRNAERRLIYLGPKSREEMIASVRAVFTAPEEAGRALASAHAHLAVMLAASRDRVAARRKRERRRAWRTEREADAGPSQPETQGIEK